jgi:hypothetical protein
VNGVEDDPQDEGHVANVTLPGLSFSGKKKRLASANALALAERGNVYTRVKNNKGSSGIVSNQDTTRNNFGLHPGHSYAGMEIAPSIVPKY